MRYPQRTIIIAHLIFLFLACSTQQQNNEKTPATLPPAEFNAQVDKATATVGDIITLSLTANSEPQLDVHITEAGSQIVGLRIVDVGEEGPKIVDTRRVRRKWYKLQPDIVGSFIIPPMSATYTDMDGNERELKTSQIFIEVTSVLKDKNAGAAQDIIDIKPLQTIPRPLGSFILYSAAVVVLIALGIFVIVYFRKKKKAAQAIVKPAHMLAFEELEKLKQEQLVERGIVKEYYVRLSEIFRRYIERRFNIPAVEKTTEEVIPDIIRLQDFSSAVKAESREILHSADLVKFAKFAPDNNASEKDYATVVHIIEETKEPEVAADTVKNDIRAS